MSLAYEMDSLKEGEALNFSLPSDAKAPVRTRRLTEEEKEELEKKLKVAEGSLAAVKEEQDLDLSASVRDMRVIDA